MIFLNLKKKIKKKIVNISFILQHIAFVFVNYLRTHIHVAYMWMFFVSHKVMLLILQREVIVIIINGNEIS